MVVAVLVDGAVPTMLYVYVIPLCMNEPFHVVSGVASGPTDSSQWGGITVYIGRATSSVCASTMAGNAVQASTTLPMIEQNCKVCLRILCFYRIYILLTGSPDFLLP